MWGAQPPRLLRSAPRRPESGTADGRRYTQIEDRGEGGRDEMDHGTLDGCWIHLWSARFPLRLDRGEGHLPAATAAAQAGGEVSKFANPYPCSRDEPSS